MTPVRHLPPVPHSSFARCASVSVAFVLTLVFAAPTFAGLGRIEINQASVAAAGGFPHVLTQPGSYLLTSDLVVAGDVGGLLFDLSGHATLDLNGFRIEGASGCSPGSCTVGAAAGIAAGPLASVRVENGIVVDFSGDCLSLGQAGEAEGLLVSGCGRDGIVLGSEGSARTNRVQNLGGIGLALSPTARYAHNTILRTGLAGSSRAVGPGTATAGNYCDDDTCSRRGARRYYLTTGLFEGDEALSACDAGFHMAASFELSETTGLEYDPGRGLTRDDSGRGPPWLGTRASSDDWGYAHSGRPTIDPDGTSRNCLGWTLSGAPTVHHSNVAWTGAPWALPNDSKFMYGSGWFTSSLSITPGPAGGFIHACVARRVWCIEN